MIPSYPRTLHWPSSLTVHRDDQYHPDPTWFLDRPVVITEKLDGGVTGISASKVYARSSGDTTHEPWFNYVKAATLPKLYHVPEELVVWGEDLFGVHSIEYDPLPDTFFLFHILSRSVENIGTEITTGDRFWAWENAMIFARHHTLRHVPVLFQGRFKRVEDITEWFMAQIGTPSALGPKREGFVMRSQDGFPFEEFGQNTCKFVRAKHVQTDSHWKKNWKPARIANDRNNS